MGAIGSPSAPALHRRNDIRWHLNNNDEERKNSKGAIRVILLLNVGFHAVGNTQI